MRVFILLALLLVPLVAAHGHPEYWTVVYDDASASDVVSAANFAASMKGSVAVDFTGKTFSQARDAMLTQELDETFIVIFDGTEATIMADGFSQVTQASRTYLERQGFSVDVVQPDESFFLPEQNEEEPEVCPMDAKVCPDGSTVGRDPDNCEEFLPCPEEPVAQDVTSGAEKDIDEDDHQPMPLPEDPEDTGPNVFVRVWQWFTGIFG